MRVVALTVFAASACGSGSATTTAKLPHDQPVQAQPSSRAEPPPALDSVVELDLPPGWVDVSSRVPDMVFAAMKNDGSNASTIIIGELPKQEFATLASCVKLEYLMTQVKKPRRATSELTRTGGLGSCTITLWLDTEVEVRHIFGTPEQPFDFACVVPDEGLLGDCTTARTSLRLPREH